MTEEEIKIDKEVSMSEQMERTSVNISTFSALSEETGMPYNFPLILGGEDIIKDSVAKLKVEEAFGQLNIQSLFGFEEHVLQSVIYNTFRTVDTGEKLTPHIYLLKSFTNDVYLLNYLATPYADLNISAYFQEVAFMSSALSGVFRRTAAQVKKGEIDEEKQYEICRETVENLVGYMHYQIFTERGLRELVSQDHSQISMVLGMFVELIVDTSEYQCLGECGKTFAQDDAMFGESRPEDGICPECRGQLVNAPPILKLDKIQFLYPPRGEEVIKKIDESSINPLKYLGYFTGVLMPRNLTLTVNRLSPEHFATLCPVPSKVMFKTKENGAQIQLNTNFRIEEDRVILFTSFSDSRFAGREYEDIFIPSLSAITLNRDIVEGFKKGLSLKRIIRSSLISDWVLTKRINYKELENYTSFVQIPVEEK